MYLLSRTKPVTRSFLDAVLASELARGIVLVRQLVPVRPLVVHQELYDSARLLALHLAALGAV